MVNGIYEDREGILWISSINALSRVDRKTGHYTFYQTAGPGASPRPTAIVEDRSGSLWIGSDNHGLARFDPKTGLSRRFRHSPTDQFSLSSDYVTHLLIDHAGTLWATTWDGLDRFDPATSHFTVIRVYADTTESQDPKIYAQRMKERKEVMGLTWLKMDLGVEMVASTPGTVNGPSNLTKWEENQLEHPFLAAEVTDKGIKMLEEYVAAVRDAVGMEIPLSMDHLGHLGVKSIIRLGQAYEKYNLSWIEDVIPWIYTDLLKQISDHSPTPILTGEDIYLKEPFRVLCEKHAVSKIQPDLATSGGILETHKIGDMAEEYGVPMAMHFAGTPVSCMANVHCAAATQNFLALENHSLDVPWWSSMVQEYVKTPIVNHGWIDVPDGPGLGVTLNDDVLRQHLAPGTGYFEPTPHWDQERSWDRLWS
jgi:L-alanine-DL-glutamate epimerase-like enolase superfamily enzyme